MVDQKLVAGWDDPRLLTLAALRRRGYTQEILNQFCDLVNVTRNEQLIKVQLLENTARTILFRSSQKAMMVLEKI
jgi:glutaminyl-tRNA synthetase